MELLALVLDQVELQSQRVLVLGLVDLDLALEGFVLAQQGGVLLFESAVGRGQVAQALLAQQPAPHRLLLAPPLGQVALQRFYSQPQQLALLLVQLVLELQLLLVVVGGHATLPKTGVRGLQVVAVLQGGVSQRQGIFLQQVAHRGRRSEIRFLVVLEREGARFVARRLLFVSGRHRRELILLLRLLRRACRFGGVLALPEQQVRLQRLRGLVARADVVFLGVVAAML